MSSRPSQARRAMPSPRCTSLFQVNTRVRLAELATMPGRPATLDDIPNGELDELADNGFDLEAGGGPAVE